MGLKLLKNVGVLMVLLMELSRLALDVMTSHERLASNPYDDPSLLRSEGVGELNMSMVDKRWHDDFND